MMFAGIHHVLLAMPPGGEAEARAFFGGIWGLPEVEKPAELAGRGGVWFETAALRLHLGGDADFVPARRAHPAFEVMSLDAFTARMEAAGVAWVRAEDLPGIRRVFVDDPFGNRIEVLEAARAGEGT